MNTNDILNIGKDTIKLEMEGLQALHDNFQDDDFVKAVEILSNVEGKIICMGIGKTGHIGKKFAATLASTGSSAFFVSAAEANHGDLGMLDPKDVLIAISHSGESNELFSPVKYCAKNNIPVIAMTNRPTSTLGKNANIVLKNFVEQEACPLNLAPTTSTTVTLALSDALAMAVMINKGFSAEDFGRTHPNGKLGAKLAPAKDMMSPLPVVNKDLTILQAMKAINDGGLGCGVVMNGDNSLQGFISDGDLRRGIVEYGVDSLISEVMNTNPLTIPSTERAVAGYNLMTEKQVTSLVVVDEQGKPVGILDKKVCDGKFS